LAVHDVISSLFREAALDDAGRSLWEPALPSLELAVTGGDEEPFLGAVEDIARGAGIGQGVPVVALLDAYTQASGALLAGLQASDDDRANEAARRLRAIERVALTRIAAGYSAGLEETISRLRARAADVSPVDGDTGAIKAVELLERLDLEVNRCQRMNLSLGLLALEPQAEGAPETAARRSGGPLHQVGDCLRGNLRRYDSIGLTSDGGFLLVLPDISRRGLAGAAERLRRELAAFAGPSATPRVRFALAHYDYVDLNAGEMLEALDDTMRRARVVREPITWS
jgi:hypothetical protein